MSEKIGWDKYEIALLIDACEKVALGKNDRQQTVSYLSVVLRRRALSSGLTIDDLFRNENGIELQMRKIEYVLTEGEKGLPGASKSFYEIATLKKENITEFNNILNEAKKQIINENKTEVDLIRESFSKWLDEQPEDMHNSNSIIAVLEDASNYALKHKLINDSFWESFTVDEFIKKYSVLSKNRIFRITKNRLAVMLDKVYVYFANYLRDQEKQHSAKASNTDEKIEADAKTEEIELYEKIRDALKVFTEQQTRGVSVLQIYEKIGGSLPAIKDVLDKVEWAHADGKLYRFVELSSNTTQINTEEVQHKFKNNPYPIDEIIRKRNPVAYKRIYETLKALSLQYPEGVPFREITDKVSFGINGTKNILNRVSWAKHMNGMLYLFVNTDDDISKITDNLEETTEDLSLFIGEKVTAEKSTESIRSFNLRQTELSEFEIAFSEWLSKKGMASPTIKSYASAIHSAELFARINNISDVDFSSNDYDVVLKSVDILLSNPQFIKHNQKQHNRFSAAFRKLRDYISELDRRNTQYTSDTELEVKNPILYHKLYSVSKVFDDPQGLTVDRILTMVGDICSKVDLIEFLDRISWATKLTEELYSFAKNVKPTSISSVVEQKTEEIELDDYDKTAFIRVLMSRYQSGLQFDSIDFENFRDTYEDMYDEKLTFSDEELEVRLKYCGILYKDRLFPAEGIIDNGTKERLFAYIENKFAVGNKVLYYKAIFSDLADAFAYCFSLTDEQMLKAYIEHTAEKGKYYFHSNFMSTEKNVKIDHSAEIEVFMLAAGKPLSYEEVYEGLSHISKDIIYREIRIGSKFLMNEKEHYYHIDIFEFSETDGDKIAEILNKEIDENGYAIWSKVFDSVKEQMPIFIENNLYLSPLGIRNALSRFMAERFDFDGEVISAYGSHLGMADVFRLYAKHNTPFSDTDLYNFAKATDTTIYFWALAEESVRVSKTLFVAKDQIEFDIEATDKALETYLSSGYILVKDVDSFLVFPNVGYEWNEFLLESYLLHYSEKFCLVNNGISLNNVAGAVAKKDGKFTQFVDICAQALADSGIELKKAIALNYLADINLITRRSYKEIDVAMTKARQIRNQKG